MLKKIFTTAVAGAMVLALAGTATAATKEINLYGASAQFLYWTDAADNFLSAKGCTGITQATAPSPDNKTHGITKGTCGSDTVIIRYTSKASYDGICAVKGHPAGGAYNCETGCGGSQFKRNMCKASDNCATLECVDVTLGASDVAGPSFVQSSEGCLQGHKTPGASVAWSEDAEALNEGCRDLSTCPSGTGTKPCWVARSFSGIDTSNLTVYNPLVVPFGFFANNSVTVTKCVAPVPKSDADATADKAISTWGNQCIPDGNGKSSLCIGYYKCIGPFTGDNGVCAGGTRQGLVCDEAIDCPDVELADTSCQAIPIDNISRLMATMIFSGQARNWRDFGNFYPNGKIAACLRHAGSGTHSTIDLAVMKGNGWGWPLMNYQSYASGPIAWFNDGSSDMMKCITAKPSFQAGNDWYAIGYADADQLQGKVKDFPNVHALKYQGVEPRRWKIRNGEYDFWSYQWIYQDPNEANPNNDNALVTELMNYAKEPENVPSTKVDYWATEKEMKYKKSGTPSADFAYPQKTTASEPQTP